MAVTDSGGALGAGDDPLFEAEDDAGEAIGFTLVVGDVQDRDAGGTMEIGEHGTDFVAGIVVEGAERFVEAQDIRAEGQGASEGDALGFAAAQALGVAVEQGGEAERFGDFGDTGAHVGVGPFPNAQSEGEVFGDGEVMEQGGFLGDEADAA
jgi:hypothetical protein